MHTTGKNHIKQHLECLVIEFEKIITRVQYPYNFYTRLLESEVVVTISCLAQNSANRRSKTVNIRESVIS